MKKILKYIVPVVVLLAAACSQHDALMYESDPQVCFYRGDDGYGQQDSILHSFFLVSDTQDRDTVWVELALIGFPADEPRAVNIVQTNKDAADAAVAGTHYVALDDPEVVNQIVIGAGQAVTKIPIILLRDISLKTGKKRLELTVEANTYFKPGIDADRNFMIQTTELAEKPSNWDDKASWKNYFGEWSSQKMWFIVNYLGLTEFEETYDTGYKTYLKLKAHSKLNEYNASHDEPLCDNPNKHHEEGEVCKDCVVFP